MSDERVFRGRRALRIALLAVVLAATTGYGAAAAARWLYPLAHDEVIAADAARNGLDPFLVAAVIRVESRFLPEAVSEVGARGLMQVLPATGRWVAAQIGIPRYRDDMLFDPAVNIAIGTWYLAYLRAEFDGGLPASLAAYNAGRHNVRQWLASGRWDGSERGLAAVPFPETRLFVHRVLWDYRVYSRLYRDRFPTPAPVRF